MDNIPVGADVFFSGSGTPCNTCGNKAGHVGVYVGDGYMVHAMNKQIRKDKVSTIAGYSNLTYIGWGWHGGITIISNQVPEGCLDNVSGGAGKLYVRGWAFDYDDPGASLGIHVYIDGPAGSGTCIGTTTANVSRPDVDNVYHTGSNHGYDAAIACPAGTHSVYVYAIDTAGGHNPCIGEGTVTVAEAGQEMTSGYDRTIPDGDYAIVLTSTLGSDSFYFLDINGRELPAASGTNVNICAGTGDPAAMANYELWTVKYGDDGFYTITQKDTNISLDVVDASRANAANVQVHQVNGSSAQKWAISRNDSGYRIQAKCSGFSLDNSNGVVATDNNVWVCRANDSAAQRWTFVPVNELCEPCDPILPDGDYAIVMTSTVGSSPFYYLDAQGYDVPAPDQANVQLFSSSEAFTDLPVSDYWTLTYRDGYYTITQMGSNAALDAAGGMRTSLSKGTNVQIFASDGKYGQQWSITKNGDGYRLKSRLTGYSLDITGGTVEDRTNIRVWTANDSAAQRWSFIPVNRDISQATVSVIEDQTFIGSAITPKPTVTWGGIELVEGTDYTLSYSNNSAVGVATVTITGKGGYVNSKDVTFSIVSAAPTITAQPQDVTGAVGTMATFTVTAEGTDLTYQWYWRAKGSTAWNKSSQVGNKTNALSVPIIETRDGQSYCCVVTSSSNDSVTSDVATLHVRSSLTIASQPADFTGPLGAKATFTVAAKGTDISYQWQWSRDNGKTWTNSSSAFVGYRSASMQVPITEARDGYLYRCVVTDESGKSVTSDSAKLTIGAAGLAITKQPEDFIGPVGSKATFTVAAKGESLTYQWQWSRDNGKTWTNSSSNFTGYRSASMQVPITSARNGYQYRCVVIDSSGSVVTSDAATLTIGASALAITSQPADYVGPLGSKATFTIAAAGEGLTYRWQWSRDNGKTWANSSSACPGYNTATMQVPITEARNGYLYRCVVTDTSGATVTSGAATLTAGAAALTIVSQPSDYEGVAGATASFAVKTNGSGVTYQWQWSRDNGKTWSNSSSVMMGYNTATLQVPITSVRNGYLYRCVAIDASGAMAVSNAAKLTVVDQLSAAAQQTVATVESMASVAGEFDTVPDAPESPTAEAAEPTEIDLLATVSESSVGSENEASESLSVESETATPEQEPFEVKLALASDEDVDPAKLSCALGDKLVLIADVDGEGFSFQWQVFDVEADIWVDLAGQTSSELAFYVAAETEGRVFRCAIVDAQGSCATIATLVCIDVR